MVRTQKTQKPVESGKERSEDIETMEGELLKTDHCPNSEDNGQNYLDVGKGHDK